MGRRYPDSHWNPSCANSQAPPATPFAKRCRPWCTPECWSAARVRVLSCLLTGHNAALLTDYFAAAKDRDLLELREALDVTAAGLAAQRRDDEDIEALRKLLARRNGVVGRAGGARVDRGGHRR